MSNEIFLLAELSKYSSLCPFPLCLNDAYTTLCLHLPFFISQGALSTMM